MLTNVWGNFDVTVFKLGMSREILKDLNQQSLHLSGQEFGAHSLAIVGADCWSRLTGMLLLVFLEILKIFDQRTNGWESAISLLSFGGFRFFGNCLAGHSNLLGVSDSIHCIHPEL